MGWSHDQKMEPLIHESGLLIHEIGLLISGADH